MSEFQFNYSYLRAQLEGVIEAGYTPMTCEGFASLKAAGALPPKVWVNRIDVDFAMQKVGPIRDLLNAIGVPGTFFIRLHAPEYNPFAFESYRVLRLLLADGHEIGYHSEVIDQAAIWDEDPAGCLRRDLDMMKLLVGRRVVGAASHGGQTGLNNLDFWKDRHPREFGLVYEAYDREPEFNLFHESLYVSDSEWTRWKCYYDGKLVDGDRRGPHDHARDGHSRLYTVIHPDTYFQRHFYE